MKRYIYFLSLMLVVCQVRADIQPSGVHVEVSREGNLYSMAARFDSSLNTCAAYHYLTDYEAAKELPGVIESVSVRQSADTVRVDRTADEQVLFLRVRLRSVMEYKERPADGISFYQVQGDSKRFQGSWHVAPHPHGSTFHFQGIWEPDTVIPLFIIDHFAKNGLKDRFGAIAQLAEKNKNALSISCNN